MIDASGPVTAVATGLHNASGHTFSIMLLHLLQALLVWLLQRPVY
jgi:hypothetical protein